MKHNIMVCVTGPKTCDKLISRGLERSADSDIHAVEYLFTAAQLAGAELILLRADNVDDALVEYAEKNGIDMIIMGSSPVKLDHETIVTRLQRRLPNVEFDIIGQ